MAINCIPGTFLETKHQDLCTAPKGQVRVILVDTVDSSYCPQLHGDFATLKDAQREAEGQTGECLNVSGQTPNKGYIFDEHGELKGEAGSF